MPKRTSTNIRYYDDEDLRRLLNIALLNNRGYKISEIARMDESLLNQRVQDETLRNNNDFHTQIQALTLHMMELNERGFDRVMSTAILQLGLEKTMVNIIFPFLYNVGMLWQTGAISPAHEHFISNLIRQKLIVAIDGQNPKFDEFSKKYMLFLPEGELHEAGLLFASYAIQARGHRVVYLGQNINQADVQMVYNHYKPDYVLTAITSPLGIDGGMGAFLEESAGYFNKSRFYISGMQTALFNEPLPENVYFLRSFKDMLQQISEVA